MTDSDQLRVLFVCSRNQWRSPTAETIYRFDHGVLGDGDVELGSAEMRIAGRRVDLSLESPYADMRLGEA